MEEDRNPPSLSYVPYTTMAQFNNILFATNSADQTNTRDDAGLPLVYGFCKLLDMLGYGSMISKDSTAKNSITQKYLGLDGVGDGNNPLVYSVSQSVNMLPLLAYQKIYFDFYSNSQWEKHLAYSYNVDYWQGTSYITLYHDMLKLRYANYPKDYFMGILPSSQYGSVAVLPGVLSPSESPSRVYAYASGAGSVGSILNSSSSTTVVTNNASTPARYATLNSDLPAYRDWERSSPV